MKHTRTLIALGLVLAIAAASPPAYADSTAKDSKRDAPGLLVLPDSDSEIPAQLADAYGMAEMLSEENPTDFGFPTIDLVEAVVILPVISDRGRQVRDVVAIAGAKPEELDAILSTGTADSKRAPKVGDAAAELSSRVKMPVGETSRRAVERIKDDVFDLAIGPPFVDSNAWASEIDPISGVVILRAEKLSPALAAAIVSRFGKKAVAVRIAKRPRVFPNSRLNDSEPFYGGARINAPSGGCTDAFSWMANGTSAMLTAGHCAPKGGTVSTPASSLGSIGSGSDESWTNGTGTVLMSGQSTYRGDIARVTISLGRVSAPRIYVGASNSTYSSAVGQMAARRALSGDTYCVGGSVGGEICSWTVSAGGANFLYSNGERVRGAVISRGKQGWCAQPGDSGGPVYTYRPDGKVSAMGIHSGGTDGGGDYYGGLLDPCVEIYTDIYDAYYGFPGYLKTG